MYTFSKYLKNKSAYNYSKEYNIVAIISMILIIMTTLSFVIGAIFVYSYLSKLDKITIFMQVIEDKLLYATSFVSFIILIIILFYSIIPSLLLVYNKNYKYSKKENINNLCGIFLTNMALFILVLLYAIYKVIEKETWGVYLHIFDLISPAIITYSLLHIVDLIINGIKKNNLCEMILFLLVGMLPPLLILLLGKETYEHSLPFSQDDILTLIVFWFIPLLASIPLNGMVLFWEPNKTSEKVLIVLFSLFLWLIPLYNMSPFVMKILGVNESKIKPFNIKNENKEGRILLNYGEKWIFLEKDKEYHESITLEKNEIKIIEGK